MVTQFILKNVEIPKAFLLFFCMVGLAAAAVQNTANFLTPTSAELSCSINAAAVAALLSIFYSKTTPRI
jgi:hypothetical protein